MEDTTDNEAPKKNMSPNVKALVGAVVGVLLIALALSYFVVDGQTQRLSESPFVLAGAKILRIPAATVNGERISYVDYVDDKNTLEQFYKNPPSEFSSASADDISDMTISRLVATELVSQLAKNNNITVSDEDTQDARTKLLENFDSEEAAQKEVMEGYGWDLDTYVTRVMIPLVREDKLRKAFENNEIEQDADVEETEEVKARHILFRVEEDAEDAVVKAQATEVLNRIKNGESFETLAAEFGSDGTSESGGDLGWFARGVMVPEFEDAAFALQAGQLSDDLIRSEFGYHIVRVDERHVVRDFLVFMDQRFRESEVKILIPIHNPFETVENDAPLQDVTDAEIQAEEQPVQ